MKKGFTLVELLAVIVILSILAVVCFRAITSSIRKTRQESYDRQITSLEQTTENYILQENITVTTPIYVTIQTLYNNGYLKEQTVNNPMTDKPLSGCVKVQYDDTINQNTYQYTTTCY